jgi:hypothetical protein
VGVSSDPIALIIPLGPTVPEGDERLSDDPDQLADRHPSAVRFHHHSIQFESNRLQQWRFALAANNIPSPA